ncbi:Subtilase family protein [Thiothrix eikelboomii]|uniref:Subtilase family protein n=1 Tax=Thiothrix eikelboomii TaxID=92487 RepID=A0A1T4WAL7_9GAMM|nr:S8 family peptidase [Thiothrix eikelboomii]SKA74336.1 Subtilase family protein [Thiothrix eikelboomii]
MADNQDLKPHIFIGKNGKPEKYTHPGSGGGKSPQIPALDRSSHAANLKNQLNQVAQRQTQLAQQASLFAVESPIGLQVTFESFPGIDMAFESLADARQKIELLNVRHIGTQIQATILVPPGKLAVIEKKLESYLSYKTNKNGQPCDNRKLIDAIQSIREAALEELWSDEPDLYPKDAETVIWWEVWLPVLGDRPAVIHDFKTIAQHAGIQISENPLKDSLKFPERSILLIKANRAQLSSSALLLSNISELRKAKETAEFFDSLEPLSQREWADDLISRTVPPAVNSPYICILDTGTNNGHPLLQPFLDDNDQHTVNPEWTPTDDNGHGTGMAGLALWGDLAEPLASNEQRRVNHRIESVKLLRHSGDNEGKHLGNITSDGIALPEIAQYDRTRIYTMALSAKDSRDRGKPSAWSATVDNLACDYLGENLNPRLIVLCAGNTGDDLVRLKEYPQHNELQDIHDPGQAWNALTVGAYTRKNTITEEDARHYRPLAPQGGLSPYSTTSITWTTSMPIKPEVVFEGGNVGVDDYSCAGLHSLKLLTTHHQPNERYFSTFEATSAATALAAKFAAEIYAQYPVFWPETVRALMVHSADWTDAMRTQFGDSRKTNKQNAKRLVRCVGYGVPNMGKALWSMQNSLAMIVEDELQPFEKRKGKDSSTRDMHLHDLPWPKEQLQALGEVEVTMTVTLSYFIESNPSSRNVSSKYRYPSHQLRFEVKRPTESIKDFKNRLSRAVHDEEEGTSKAPSDPNWLFGDFRHKGSVHKDIWSGTAAELADRGHIAVYPAMGWWRTRTQLERYDKKARYSLIVSIEAPSVGIDLYTGVLTAIEASNPIGITVSSN